MEPRDALRLLGLLEGAGDLRLMDKILHDLKDPKLWELRYIPYYGSCRILSINCSKLVLTRVIIRVTPFRALITLLITYLLSPLPLQVRVVGLGF